VKVTALVSLLCAASALAAPPTESAEALFALGRKLSKEGRHSEACAAFAQSQKLAPGLGTQLNLAECHEKQGLTATAHRLYLGSADWAAKDGQTKREALARSRADRLRPQLSWVSVKAPEGLRIEVDGAAMEGTEVALDPGLHAFAAREPEGAEVWSVQLMVPPGPSAQQLTVPASALEPKPVVVKSDAPVQPTLVPARVPSSEVVAVQKPTSRVLPKIATGTGALLLAAGVAGIVHSQATLSAVQQQQPGGPMAESPTVTRAQYEQLRVIQPASIASAAVGSALLAGGLYFWLRAEP
jgi:hypothetical protein